MRERALDGLVGPANPLSPRRAFDGLSRLGRAFVVSALDTPWEHDTRALPPPLATHRRRLRAFAERHLAPVASAVDREPHHPPGELSVRARDVLSAAGRAGLLSDLLPAPFGSTRPSMIGGPLAWPQCLKTEELAAVDGGLMLIVCAHTLGVAPILLSGDLGAIRRYVLPSFRDNAAGKPHLLAYAITEPAAGSDVEEGHGASTLKPGVIAERVAGGYRLRGRKCFISGGDLAKTTVVFAALSGEGIESWTAFAVSTDRPGYIVHRTERKMGMRASGAAEILLDGVFVEDEAILLGLRKGWALNRATLNLSRLPVAAMGVGLARSALEAATTFVCRERLGGKPLVDYQEVQLALADMLAETQAGRAMVWQAASRRQPIAREASAAKVFCTDMAISVCTRAMDLLGNHAMLHQLGIERAYRDARLTQIFEGTNQINRLSIIEDVQEDLLATIERCREDRAR